MNISGLLLATETESLVSIHELGSGLTSESMNFSEGRNANMSGSDCILADQGRESVSSRYWPNIRNAVGNGNCLAILAKKNVVAKLSGTVFRQPFRGSRTCLTIPIFER